MTIVSHDEVLFSAGVYAFCKDMRIRHNWNSPSSHVWPTGTEWYVYEGRVVVSGAVAANHIQLEFQKHLNRLITE